MQATYPHAGRKQAGLGPPWPTGRDGSGEPSLLDSIRGEADINIVGVESSNLEDFTITYDSGHVREVRMIDLGFGEAGLCLTEKVWFDKPADMFSLNTLPKTDPLYAVLPRIVHRLEQRRAAELRDRLDERRRNHWPSV